MEKEVYDFFLNSFKVVLDKCNTIEDFENCFIRDYRTFNTVIDCINNCIDDLLNYKNFDLYILYCFSRIKRRYTKYTLNMYKESDIEVEEIKNFFKLIKNLINRADRIKNKKLVKEIFDFQFNYLN